VNQFLKVIFENDLFYKMFYFLKLFSQLELNFLFRILFSYFSLMVIGIGSTLFHGTLK